MAQTRDPLREFLAANVAKSSEDLDKLLGKLQDTIAAEIEDGGILVDEGDRFMIVSRGEKTTVEGNDPGNTALIKTVTLQPGDTLIHVQAKDEG